MNPHPNLVSVTEIVNRGETLYEEKFKATCEAKHAGKFVAINVVDETMHVGEYPEDAMKAARNESEDGLFHLIKIGSLCAYDLGFTGSQYVGSHSGQL